MGERGGHGTMEGQGGGDDPRIELKGESPRGLIVIVRNPTVAQHSTTEPQSPLFWGKFAPLALEA